MKCNLCDNPGNGTSKDLRGWPPGYCGFLGNVSFWFRQGGTPNDIKYPCFITKLCPHLDRYLNLPGPVALADPRINLIPWHAWVTVIKRSKGLVTLFILTAYFCASSRETGLGCKLLVTRKWVRCLFWHRLPLVCMPLVFLLWGIHIWRPQWVGGEGSPKSRQQERGFMNSVRDKGGGGQKMRTSCKYRPLEFSDRQVTRNWFMWKWVPLLASTTA